MVPEALHSGLGNLVYTMEITTVWGSHKIPSVMFRCGMLRIEFLPFISLFNSSDTSLFILMFTYYMHNYDIYDCSVRVSQFTMGHQ